MVGHDWGAIVAWSLCMFRPEKVRALVNLSVAFRPRNPAKKPVETLRALYGDDYYVCTFQVTLVPSLFISLSLCKYMFVSIEIQSHCLKLWWKFNGPLV